MKTYKLYFEFFGKKLCTEIDAFSLEDAQEEVKTRIEFTKCEEIKQPNNKSDMFGDDALNYLKDIFKMT